MSLKFEITLQQHLTIWKSFDIHFTMNSMKLFQNLKMNSKLFLFEIQKRLSCNADCHGRHDGHYPVLAYGADA